MLPRRRYEKSTTTVGVQCVTPIVYACSMFITSYNGGEKKTE